MPGATAFPAALDDFPEIGPNTPENSPGAEHDVVHQNVHAAVVALQVKVGIDASADAGSMDARLSRVVSSHLPPFNFAFGDATPAAVLTLDRAMEVLRVSLQIEEAFNGAGAQIQLGTAADASLLMDTWQNDPAMPTVFETIPREELAAGTDIVLTLTPGIGASQGAGQFVITAIPAL